MGHLLDTRALEVFVAVSDALSMSGAGRILGISQAAVSQQIAKLEETLGLKVVERGARELRLTPAGIHLRHLARRVLLELAQTERAMTRFRGFSLPRFTIGLMESMSEILSSTIIDVLNAQVEQLELRTSLNYQYREHLFDESLDLVITPDMAEQEGLEVHNLATEPLVLVVPKGHPVGDEINLDDIASRLPHAGFNTRRRIGRMVEHYLMHEAVIVPRTIAVDQTTTLLDAVRHGQAWALVTPFVLMHGTPADLGIDVHPLPGQVPTRTIAVAAKAGRFGELPLALATACRHTMTRTIDDLLARLGPRVARSIVVHAG